MFKMGYENVSSCFFITFCWQVDVDKTAISVFIVRIKPTFPKCLEVFGPLVFRTYYLCCSHCAPKVYCLLLAQHFTTFTGGKKPGYLFENEIKIIYLIKHRRYVHYQAAKIVCR